MALTAERLRELLSYDPETGVWTRRVTVGRCGRWRAGTVAGSSQKNGYRIIYIDGRHYYEHRLAWLYMTGEWPAYTIDHIDRNPSNNRWSNLRKATQPENSANTKLRSNNTSGAKGVHWLKQNKTWRASIMIDGKTKYLGSFESRDEAIAAYRAAAQAAWGEFAAAA